MISHSLNIFNFQSITHSEPIYQLLQIRLSFFTKAWDFNNFRNFRKLQQPFDLEEDSRVRNEESQEETTKKGEKPTIKRKKSLDEKLFTDYESGLRLIEQKLKVEQKHNANTGLEILVE